MTGSRVPMPRDRSGGMESRERRRLGSSNPVPPRSASLRSGTGQRVLRTGRCPGAAVTVGASWRLDFPYTDARRGEGAKGAAASACATASRCRRTVVGPSPVRWTHARVSCRTALTVSIALSSRVSMITLPVGQSSMRALERATSSKSLSRPAAARTSSIASGSEPARSRARRRVHSTSSTSPS
jgi:hypothetical protein